MLVKSILDLETHPIKHLHHQYSISKLGLQLSSERDCRQAFLQSKLPVLPMSARNALTVNAAARQLSKENLFFKPDSLPVKFTEPTLKIKRKELVFTGSELMKKARSLSKVAKHG